jgi:hypothetical protein
MEEALARQLTESSTSTPSWADWDKSVKDLLCVGITAVAALIEVSATMVLAYPEHRAKTKGYEQDPKHQKIQMVVNIVLSLTMVGVYTVGSFFGPVSLSVPAAMASKLVWNMLFLGIVLRMTNFAKEARVGTYILVFSIVAIPGVGPSDQPDLDIIANMTQPAAIVWLSLLSAATLACCAGMVVLKLRPNALPPVGVYAVLLTGQVTSAVVGTSAGKTFALLSGVPLALAFVVNTIVGAVNLLSVRHSVAAGAQGALPSSTESPLSHRRRLRPAAPRTPSHGAAQNVFAATACDQAIFIPLQTLATLLVNCVTGLVVWQEWSVIAVPSTWTRPSPPPTAPTLHTRPGA